MSYLDTFVINPGTGNVRSYGRVQERWSLSNVNRFAEACCFASDWSCDVVKQLRRGETDDGRWAYKLKFRCGRKRKSVLVEMPGCSFAVLTGERLGSAPRMYVDGSSYWWQFAVELVRECELGLDS